MSNDLISRSALLQKIQQDKEFLQKGLGRDAEYAYMSVDSVMEKINSMPTAYDVDKVVERLRKEISDCMCDECDRHTDCDTCRAEKAVEIVKSGGIE